MMDSPSPNNPLPPEVYQKAVLDRLTTIEALLKELLTKQGAAPAAAPAKPKPEPVKLTDVDKEYVRMAGYPSDCKWMLENKPVAYQAAIVFAVGQQFKVPMDKLTAIGRKAANSDPPNFPLALIELDHAY
jgi:hypothetical protein